MDFNRRGEKIERDYCVWGSYFYFNSNNIFIITCIFFVILLCFLKGNFSFFPPNLPSVRGAPSSGWTVKLNLQQGFSVSVKDASAEQMLPATGTSAQAFSSTAVFFSSSLHLNGFIHPKNTTINSTTASLQCIWKLRAWASHQMTPIRGNTQGVRLFCLLS